MKISDSCTLASLLSVASAHTIMQSFNGNAQGVAIYMPSDNSFQSDVNSPNLACNGAPVTGFKSSSTKITIQAGSTVTGAWLHQLDSTPSNPGTASDSPYIPSSHKGPVMAYMKKVTDATQNPSAGPGDGWFKISEAGLISPTQWAMDALVAAKGIQSTTIPTCIANGDYLLRFEFIGLHNAFAYPGAQFYMECAQITVTGGTGTATPATVSFPGAYKASDPGISINIYNGNGQPYPSSGKYTIPGPPVFTCPSGSSGGGSTTIPTTLSTIPTTSTKVPTTSTKVPTSTTTAPSTGGVVAQWGQCGGIGYNGATACAGGFTCHVSNAYYSQCY